VSFRSSSRLSINSALVNPGVPSKATMMSWLVASIATYPVVFWPPILRCLSSMDDELLHGQLLLVEGSVECWFQCLDFSALAAICGTADVYGTWVINIVGTICCCRVLREQDEIGKLF